MTKHDETMKKCLKLVSPPYDTMAGDTAKFEPAWQLGKVRLCSENDGFCSENDEFCIQHDGFHEFCIQHDGFCSENDGFCTENDEFCIQHDGFCTKNDEFGKVNNKTVLPGEDGETLLKIGRGNLAKVSKKHEFCIQN